MKKLPNIVLSPFEEGFMLPFHKAISTELKSKLVFTKEVVEQSVRIVEKNTEAFKSEIVQIFALKIVYEVLSGSRSELLTGEMKESLREEFQKTQSEVTTSYSHLVERILELLSVAHRLPVQQAEEQKHQKDSRAQMIKERQKKIAQEFLKKQQVFAMKNQANLNEVIISPQNSSLDCCSYCKEDTSKATFSEKPFGYLCFLTTSGIYKKAYKDPCTLRLSLIHICRCRRLLTCRSRWSPYH
eukprot:TRINITY_DN22459_c0_g1_i1.p1 TRINITY_DN22459_c0_g1~~TRINITY_DN22459_c0_g1_i1.p1  ORF type:complete len:242 (-),score=73.48 TRINITY_DN22459_c0_g1_i1:10-735(-)